MTQILKITIRYNFITQDWAKHCKLIKGDITAVTKVPKPYEDINTFLIYRV